MKSKRDIFNSEPPESEDLRPEEDPFIERTFDEILEMKVTLPHDAHVASPALIVSKLNQCDEYQKRLYDLSCEVNRKLIGYEHLISLKQMEYDVHEVAALRDISALGNKASAQDKKTAIKHYTSNVTRDMVQLTYQRDQCKLVSKQIDKKSDEIKNVSIQIQSINKILAKAMESMGDRSFTVGPPDSPSSRSLASDLVDVENSSKQLQELLDRFQGDNGETPPVEIEGGGILVVEKEKETAHFDCVERLEGSDDDPSEGDLESLLELL